MKSRNFLLIILSLFLVLGSRPTVLAQQNGREKLKAIFKLRATIPAEARTASILGAKREGNGVLIDDQGHVLTIGYLILEAEKIELVGPTGEVVEAAFVAYDHRTGFGLIKAGQPLGVTPLELGRSAQIEPGDPLLVAGHGGSDSAQAARVVSRGEFAGYWEYLLEKAIYTSPPHPDYGGAALLDQEGRLVGIGSLYSQLAVEGYGAIPCNVSVPIDLLKPILADLISLGRSSAPPQPWLGVNVAEVRGRVFVNRVTADGPAARGGLLADDIILTVNQEGVRGLSDFFRKVWALGTAGVEVPLTVLRGVEIKTLTIRSSDRSHYLQTPFKKKAEVDLKRKRR